MSGEIRSTSGDEADQHRPSERHGRGGSGADARLRAYVCGSTRHDVAQIVRGMPHERRRFPATVFLYTDGERRVLFDTGYAPPPWPGLKAWIYRRLLPPEIAPGETIDARLRAAGVAPKSITHVVLSHLHPDHIGGVRYFPQARFVLGAGAIDALRRSRLSESVLTRLLPEWFEDADVLVVGAPDDPSLAPLSPSPAAGAAAESRRMPRSVVDGPYGLRTHDLFGDGSYLVVDLPGHARGHLGALIQGRVLLAGDATWNRDLLGREADLRLLPRLISLDHTAQAATARHLLAVEDAGIRLLFSHDHHPIGVDLL